MKQLRHTKAVVLALALAYSCLSAALAAEQYWPPRDQPKPVNQGHAVGRTERPFEFHVYRLAWFDTRDEAEAFAKQQIKVFGIVPVGKRFKVQYVARFSREPVVPAVARGFWTQGKPNYFLYRALLKYYKADSDIRNGALGQYMRGSYASKEKAAEATVRWGEMVSCEPQTLSNGKTVWRARYRKQLDVLAEARTLWENNELAEKHLILTDIGPFQSPGAHAPMAMEGGRAPGRMMGIGYLRKDLPGKGCNVYVYLADEDDSLDHNFLRYFVMEAGLAVRKHKDGQVVVVGGGGRPTAWKASPRTYYKVAGSKDRELVLEAYLKKFPSILPADYAVDTRAWAREELRRIIERMRGLVESDTPKGTRYLSDYGDFCKWVEPPPGAPAFPPDAPFDKTLRTYHFARLDAWWQQHKDALKFRKGAPLSQREVIRTMPNRTDLLKKALDEYRKVVEEDEKEEK